MSEVKNRLVDSHCHLNCLKGGDTREGVAEYIQHAKDLGVAHFLCVSIDMETWEDVATLADQFPEVTASVGVHPNHDEGREPSVEELVSLSQREHIVAIGETGLDYFRSEGDLEWQRDRFRRHIQAAKQVQKPLIIHTREAKADTIAILREQSAEQAGGVMHCFTEDWDMAKASMDLGFYISFSGIVTFKTATILQEVAKKMPIDRILVETDSPYLAPIPHRGKQNQPAYVVHVAEFLAKLRNEPVEYIAEHTTENFQRLFKVAV